MARPGPRRVPLTVKVAPADLPRIDQLAAAAGVNRSEWIREVLTEALWHRTHRAPRLPPAGSRPRTDQPPVVAEPYLEAP